MRAWSKTLRISRWTDFGLSELYALRGWLRAARLSPTGDAQFFCFRAGGPSSGSDVEEVTPTAFAGTAIGVEWFAEAYRKALRSALAGEYATLLAEDAIDFDYVALHECVEDHADRVCIVMARLKTVASFARRYPLMALGAKDHGGADIEFSRILRPGHNALRFMPGAKLTALSIGAGYPTFPELRRRPPPRPRPHDLLITGGAQQRTTTAAATPSRIPWPVSVATNRQAPPPTRSPQATAASPFAAPRTHRPTLR